MTQVHYSMPRELEELTRADGLRGTAGLCVICVLSAKGDQVATTRPIWEPLLDDGQDSEQKWISYHASAGRVIRDAVIVALCDLVPGVLLPLCWDHVAALAPADTRPVCGWCHGTGRKEGRAIEAARGPLPPALGNGGLGKGRG